MRLVKGIVTCPGVETNIIPTMKYDDAPAAITWLCRAFGFEEHMVATRHAAISSEQET